MYNSQVKLVNEQLAIKHRAIVAIGCSFVQGQGAINDEIFEKYNFGYTEAEPLAITVDNNIAKKLLSEYPMLSQSPNGKIDFTFMEYENAFVNQLCKVNFNEKYVPINLGLRGCGNRSSIKELYFNKIRWDLCNEIIVIYVPSGIERFDFINDQTTDHFRWTCMWPNPSPDKTDTPRNDLWKGYREAVYSDKMAIIEQIGHVQELMTWCNLHHAKLIITPGFDRRYDKDYFKEELDKNIERDDSRIVNKNSKQSWRKKTDSDRYLDMWPWDKMFKPNNSTTMAQLALNQEPSITNKTDFYGPFLNNRSPNGWITACAHPGQKAHKLFADILSKHIKRTFIKGVNHA